MKHYLDSYKLADDERKKIEEFLSLIQNAQNSAEFQQLAFNILAARKFSVPQALELYHSYQAFLASEQITRVDPFEEDVRRELLSGKFVILNDNDIPGVRVAQFFVRLHRKSGNHRALLHSIIFQLDAALKRETAARNGLVFIFDMTDSKYSNFDYTFSCKLFKMLRSSYPVRLRRVLILTAPLWFRAPFLLMRVFIRELFQDCVYVLRPSPGTKLEALSHPDPITLKRDHYAWLQTALLRTGWLMTEAEQATLPNSHRVQTAAAFFGPASESSGSISDSSDSEFRDDDDSFSNSQVDEDDLISVGDLDPFSLTSSYSGEAENSDLEECTPDVIMKTLSSSNLEVINDINYNSKSALNYSDARTYDQKRQTLSNSEHGGTPTPPTVAKRQQLTTTENLNDPSVASDRSNSHPVVNRPSTVTASANHNTGFNEDISSTRIDPVTPTADKSVVPPASTDCDNPGERNSLCSSTTSFFSTGSAALHSTKCSPTNDKLISQILTSCSPRTGFERRSSSKCSHEASVLSTSKDHDLPLADADCFDVTHFSNVQNKSAPLAQDEIGEQTIGDNKFRSQIHPRISGNIPSWAIGRPQGESIHQFCDSVYPSEPLALRKNDNNDIDETTIHVNQLNPSSSKYLISSSFDKFPEWDNSPSLLHTSSIVNNTSRCIPTTTINTGNDNHRELLLSERQKTYDEIDANMIEINSTTSSSDGEISDNGDMEEEEAGEDEDDFEPEEDDDDDEIQTINMQEHWMNPDELVQHVKTVGLNGLNSEYSAIVQLKNEDTHIAFKHILNRNKNRYCDVICNDTSRVYLQPLLSDISGILSCRSSSDDSSSCNTQKSLTSRLHRTHSAPISTHTLVKNYIHANWVDGYRQKNAFICTQGPLSETVGDFWQMIWDYHCPVIVMITKILEAQRSKCYLYWPDSENQKLYFSSGHPGCLVAPSGRPTTSSSSLLAKSDITPDFLIENVKCEGNGNFAQTTLRLTNLQLNEIRTIEHFAFFSWPDHGTPQTTAGLLDLLTSVQSTYLKAIEQIGYTSYEDQEIPPPPVVVHCSAGIGRTGTYVTVDICTKWLTDPRNLEHKINIPLTVSRVRSQRFGCVQVPSQYVFCYRAIIDLHQTALNTLITESNSQISTVPTTFYHQSSSLPRPFCGILPNYVNNVSKTSSTFQQHCLTTSSLITSVNSSNSCSSSTLNHHHENNRSPFHELLALFTPVNLASIKNSIRFRKLKEELIGSEFPTENGILDVETCL
ncbi:unnamed protein product [Heterobilharzia americana]|nr:unnamed protein product [Heterobilharzia americana]